MSIKQQQWIWWWKIWTLWIYHIYGKSNKYKPTMQWRKNNKHEWVGGENKEFQRSKKGSVNDI